VEAELGAAEDRVALGHFADAGARLAALVPDLVAAERPELLARAAWVAAICSLAGHRLREFRVMSTIAAQATELATTPEARRELEALARRVDHLVRIAKSPHTEIAVGRVLRDHAVLLSQAKTDPERWALVDADRRDWPHLFAAIREQTGRPCELEALIEGAATDAVGAVVLAVVYGLGADADIVADALAELCFREPSAVELARRRIHSLVEAGHLERADGGRIRLPRSFWSA